MTPQAPTVNEIRFNRPRRQNASPYTVRTSRYHRGDTVAFKFGSVVRRGRITTEMHHNGISTYHIESPGGVWYREINDWDIISKEALKRDTE